MQWIGQVSIRAGRGSQLKSESGVCMSKVWLVTGSASGLGRNIADAVLASSPRPAILAALQIWWSSMALRCAPLALTSLMRMRPMPQCR